MDFNFNDLSSINVSNVSQSLKPWNIYEVAFDGIERTTIKGKKEPDKIYDTVKISFSCAKGTFSENLFIPSSGEDAQRTANTASDGHTYYSPSKFEVFKWTLLQLAQALNPEGYKKLQAQSSKIKTMDDFITLVLKVANAKKGATTHLKLIGSTNTATGVTYARIPRIVSVSKDGDLFVSNRFVGDGLEFTLYESGKAEAYRTAKPTKPKTDTEVDVTDNDSDEGKDDLDKIDFNSL